MTIGIIVAMDKEFAQLQTLVSACHDVAADGTIYKVGQLGRHTLVMLQCGIGKVNAAIGATRLIAAFRPQLVVSTGVAGGADTSLSPLDVVVGTACRYHDVYCGHEVERGQVPGMPAAFTAPADVVAKAPARARRGLIVTGDWFVDTREKMRGILRDCPTALAVDMESCAIAQACHVARTPFVSMRIVSDVPLKDTDAQQYYDFWQRMADGSFAATRELLERL